jgi:hypothetical protein
MYIKVKVTNYSMEMESSLLLETIKLDWNDRGHIFHGILKYEKSNLK